jgi:GTP pyrophosphokinase
MADRTNRQKVSEAGARELEELLADIERSRPTVRKDLVSKAYRFSERAHRGQNRMSGDPYLTHCVETARILGRLHLDSVTIAGGLLHDVIEDTETSLEEIRSEFGEEIATIVDGVTNISEMSFQSPQQEQMEKYRKMLLFMAQDVRVILIKLADRLHNMRTLEFLPHDDRIRISRETLDVFAPLAHRLGIARVKWELEDLALKYLDPEAYAYLGEQIELSREEREEYLEEFSGPLLERLKQSGVSAEITGRAKHFYSIYMKMKNQNRPIEDIFDLMAIRVLTEDVADCYKVLGVIHSMYTPVVDRIKDFIATPKKNMYRSLHTTVVGPRGEMVEIQIRTYEMHRTAEEGIAAHWRYKVGGKSDPELDRQLAWLRQTLEWSRELTDPEEFMDSLRADLYHHEIFVFTPKGDLKNLPRGATPLDFAYSVHTEVGNRCSGAKVNGRLVPLSTELKNGDTVEIVTQASSEPSIDWLHMVRTASARAKIRRWLKTRDFADNVALGREMLDRELKRERKPAASDRDLAGPARQLGKEDPGQLLAAVGVGEISPTQVVRRLFPEEEEELPALKPEPETGPPSGIRIQGIDNLMIRFARCCQPVPGDPVVGLVTRGRGISVHRAGCRNVVEGDSTDGRLIEVEWDVRRPRPFTVDLDVAVEDRRSLLADVARAIGDAGANICNAGVRSDGSRSTGTFSVQVRDRRQLENTIRLVSEVPGVRRVSRKGEAPDR